MGGGGRGQFFSGLFVDKSNKRQFSSGAISRGILSGGNYLLVYYPGAIIRGYFPEGNYPRQFSSGAIPREQLPEDQLSRGNCPGCNNPGSDYPVGNFPAAIIQG